MSRLAGLEHRLGQLLDEQRHAVGAGDDRVDHSAGRRSPPSCATIASTPARPRRLRVSRVTWGWAASAGWRSGRLVSRMSTPGGGAPVEALLDQLERGRVDPVGVLDDHQDGLPCREPASSCCGERLEGPRPAAPAASDRAGHSVPLPSRPSRSAIRARRSRCPTARSSRASSLSSLASSGSSAAKPAPRSSDAGSPARARCRRGRASTGSGRACAARRPAARAARG